MPTNLNPAMPIIIFFVAPLFSEFVAFSEGQESAKYGDSSTVADVLETYIPQIDLSSPDNFNFQRYFTKDKFDRKITFYISNNADPKARLPLAVCIQGSGAQSVFMEMETGTGVRIVSGGAEAVFAGMYAGKVRVMVVEKPGVNFLDQPERSDRRAAEEAGGASEEYCREFSLERWVEAINAATRATLTLPIVDDSRLLVLGHSEGGQVACEVAAANDQVTHVAVMAGGGATQLFDLIVFARSGDMYDPAATADERLAALRSDWQNVLKDPKATDKFILGHTHLRWSSFLNSSPVEAVLKSKAKVFVAQGTADTSTLPSSSEMLYAELWARGRDCTYERVVDGNHGFMTEGDTEGEGWVTTNRKAMDWFLK